VQAYIAKRFLLFIPTLLLATLVVFILLRLIPGDPAMVKLVGETGEAKFTQEQLEAMRAKLGTDRPLYVQYGDWIWGMLRLDFGVSLFFEEPVAKDLAAKFPITLELTVLALLIATIIAVPLGLLSAIKQDTPTDYVARIITISGVALPNFWVGILVVYFLVLFFNWMPPLGYANVWEEPGTNLKQLIFPALTLGFYNMAFTARVTRSSMLEVYREDYIRTARAKGLAERVVVLRHALKNALLPMATVSGYEFGRLLAGTVVIENIFMVPGMGKLLIDSVLHRDYITVQAIIVVTTVSVLILNLALDVIYGWLNPRIRLT
jgi:peptide/nickel transport system permease protein